MTSNPPVPKSERTGEPHPRYFRLRAGYDGSRQAWFVEDASVPPEPGEEVEVVEDADEVGAECSRLEADLLMVADAINDGLPEDEHVAINASAIVEWVEAARERLAVALSTQQTPEER